MYHTWKPVEGYRPIGDGCPTTMLPPRPFVFLLAAPLERSVNPTDTVGPATDALSNLERVSLKVTLIRSPFPYCCRPLAQLPPIFSVQRASTCLSTRRDCRDVHRRSKAQVLLLVLLYFPCATLPQEPRKPRVVARTVARKQRSLWPFFTADRIVDVVADTR